MRRSQPTVRNTTGNYARVSEYVHNRQDAQRQFIEWKAWQLIHAAGQLNYPVIAIDNV